ncbi:hypothetical protein BDY19DRAFT_991753 [Irpex rosettiformis]|uniref:Uncharacterized protein n=1 Tax=Irpex rosettiformis TaxID=378272 RepID=A0ACB8UB41_9APHY|nr:hypothetical protein BDY19DRAFT_991753 [Irpex rosettiformis]
MYYEQPPSSGPSRFEYPQQNSYPTRCPPSDAFPHYSEPGRRVVLPLWKGSEVEVLLDSKWYLVTISAVVNISNTTVRVEFRRGNKTSVQNFTANVNIRYPENNDQANFAR